MESGFVKSGGGAGQSKSNLHRGLRQYAAVLRRKHQVIGAVPNRTQPDPLLHLLDPLFLQCVKGRRRRGDGADLPAFRGGEQRLIPVARRGELLVYRDCAPGKVHGIPGKAQQLRQAEARKQGHRDHELDTAPGGGADQRGGLFIIQRADLFLLLLWQNAFGGGIPGDIVQLHRLFQRETEDVVDQAH